MYLPRLCEHCLNPACVASLPQRPIYKREEDGIVLIDQDKCRGWRMCVSGCPYKKIYNWQNRQGRKVHLLLPAHRGQPAHGLLGDLRGRIRYLGVLLYDADRIQEAASVERERDLYQAQLGHLPGPHDPAVICARPSAMALPTTGSKRVQKSPVYKMAVGGKSPCRCTRIPHPAHGVVRAAAVAHHPAANAGHLGVNGEIPDVGQLRIPVQYLATCSPPATPPRSFGRWSACWPYALTSAASTWTRCKTWPCSPQSRA